MDEGLLRGYKKCGAQVWGPGKLTINFWQGGSTDLFVEQLDPGQAVK